MKILKNIIIVLLISFYIISCDESPNEPEKYGVLDLALQSTDSVYVELDGSVICEGKVNYTGILGVSWSKRFEKELQGVHRIYYKSYLYNKEVEHKFYLDDTLTVLMYYSSQHDKIMVITRNKELWLD